MLCVGDGGGGGVVCVAAGSGTTPEPRRATPLSKLYEAQQEKHIIIISIRTENSVNKDIDVVTV